jgi:hypothetical protein
MTDTQNVSPRPRLVAERELETALDPTGTPKPNNEGNAEALLGVVELGLKVLSQRAVAFAGHLLPLFALGSGFYLWLTVLGSPSVLQLVGLGIYSLFMLTLIWMRRK